jgi:hypothetical protein
VADAADGYVQVAADGAGKKVATREFTRDSGDVVEAQQVLATDPDTGRPLDPAPWSTVIAIQKAILVELRVVTAMFADEFRVTDHELEQLRSHHEDDIR